MADDKLISKPITPSLSEVEASIDPTAALNAPAPVLPPLFNIPDGVPQTLRNNKQLQGNQNTAVVPGSARENNKEFIKALVSSASDPNLVKDRYRYGRAYSFGAGEKALNFERYYNHPKFKQFGFNPYRDNETYYNQRSSWWDDFSRMRGQWLGLVWNGFKSVWGDSRAAHEQMEKAMSIGASTRDGFGGWVTNFGMNSAYTVGIMGELALENLGFLLLETATLGGATPLATGIAGRNAIGFGRLIKTLTGTRDLVKSLKNAGSARDFYNTVYRGGKGVVNVLNPLARTTQFAKDYNKIYKAGDKISNLAFITRGFGGFYKDLREINLAVSEAGIEGEGAASQYQQQLLNEFYAANGRMPDDKEAKQIWDRVHSVRTSVSLANDFVIYGTNKLVFDGLFNGFRSGPGIQKAFLKGSGRTLEKTAAGTYKAGVTPSLQAGARTFKHKAKDFILKSPYLPWTKEYMVGNLSEGIQESSQEIITQAAINYHNKIERDPSQIGFYGVLGSIGSGLSDQFSAQGLDTFLQGYLMGSLIQGGTKTITKPYEWAKGTKKKAFAAATEQDNNILNAANHINANAMVYGKSNINTFSYVKQLNEEREKRRANGDQAGAEALTDEINTAYFHNLARSGNMGLVTEHVDDMLSLSDEELLNAYNLDHEGLTDGAEVRKRLLNLKDKATNYQKRYDKIKKIKPNPFAPWDIDKEKNPELYQKELNKYLAFEDATSNLLFSLDKYENLTNKLSEIGKNLTGATSTFNKVINVIKGGNVVANAAADDISVLIDPSRLDMTVVNLRNQIKIMELGTPKQKKEAELLKEKLEFLQEWDTMLSNFKTEMKQERKAQLSEKERTKRVARARVKTGAIVRDPETKRRYTVKEISGDYATIESESDGVTRRVKREKLEVLKDVSKKSLKYQNIEEDDLSYSMAQLYDVFEKYLRNVAKAKDGHIYNEDMNKAFDQILEYYSTETELREMMKTINVLNDPADFERYAEVLSLARQAQQAEHVNNLTLAQQAFAEQAQNNDLINLIFNKGVFLDFEDTEALKGKIVDLQNKTIDLKDIEFYYDPTKEKLLPGSQRYNELMEAIKEFALDNNLEITGTEEPKAEVKEEIVETADAEKTPAAKIEITEITTSTPVGDIYRSAPDVFRKLVDAFNKENKKRKELGDPQFVDANKSDDELIVSEEFKEFVQTSTQAGEILAPLRSELRPKVQSDSIWIPGAKVILSGKMVSVSGIVDVENEILEVIQNMGENIDEDGNQTHLVRLKALDGTLYQIDLMNPDFVAFPHEEVEETESDTFLQQKIDEYNAKLANLSDPVLKKVRVEVTDNIVNEAGQKGGARLVRMTKKLLIDPVVLRRKYEEKAWTKPYPQSDNKGPADPLPENIFTSFEQFLSFVLEHEFQHTQFPKPEAWSKAQYENEINRRALDVLGLVKKEVEGEDNFRSLLDDYYKIKNKNQLVAWDKRALNLIRKGEVTSETVNQMLKDAEKMISQRWGYEDLIPEETVVVTKNDPRTKWIIMDKNEKEVTLVKIANYNKGNTEGPKKIAKSQVKNEIKMIIGAYIAPATKVESTPEEIKTSDEVVKSAQKNIEVDPNAATKSVADALTKSKDELDSDLNDLLNKC